MSDLQTSVVPNGEIQPLSEPVFIDEEEAAHSAGVSVATLRRFEEVGALSPVISPEGRFYEIADIERLFSITVGRPRRVLPRTPPEPHVNGSVASTTEGTTFAEQSSTTSLSEMEEVLEEVTEPLSFHSADKGAFKKVLETLQRLLESKDAEIADLKSQRAWLQQRIEKLEQQSDRDRLLLLSESHTVKQLVAIEANRKSKLRATLEFFGIMPVQEPMPDPPPLSLEFSASSRVSATTDGDTSGSKSSLLSDSSRESAISRESTAADSTAAPRAATPVPEASPAPTA